MVVILIFVMIVCSCASPVVLYTMTCDSCQGTQKLKTCQTEEAINREFVPNPNPYLFPILCTTIVHCFQWMKLSELVCPFRYGLKNLLDIFMY